MNAHKHLKINTSKGLGPLATLLVYGLHKMHLLIFKYFTVNVG